jgi:hypothetical protein
MFAGLKSIDFLLKDANKSFILFDFCLQLFSLSFKLLNLYFFLVGDGLQLFEQRLFLEGAAFDLFLQVFLLSIGLDDDGLEIDDTLGKLSDFSTVSIL